MLVILSPSKTLDSAPASSEVVFSQPLFVKEASTLVRQLRKYSVSQLEELMKISPGLALLNAERLAVWRPEFTPETALQAIFAFRGEVYHGLDARTMAAADVEAAQQHLRILSGLHGVVRPLDLIRPYRLEMGIACSFGNHKNLYQFWRQKITRQLAADLKESGSDLLVNLASLEYFSAIDTKRLRARIVTPQFLEEKDQTFKMVTVYAKKARGMMTRFILQNRICNEDDLRGFDSEGYYFNSNLSRLGSPVFTR